MVKVVKLLYSTDGLVGEGIEDDPVRAVYQLYTKEGELVLRYDSNQPQDIIFNPHVLQG